MNEIKHISTCAGGHVDGPCPGYPGGLLGWLNDELIKMQATLERESKPKNKQAGRSGVTGTAQKDSTVA